MRFIKDDEFFQDGLIDKDGQQHKIITVKESPDPDSIFVEATPDEYICECGKRSTWTGIKAHILNKVGLY